MGPTPSNYLINTFQLIPNDFLTLSKVVRISACPVQSNMKFVNIPRPNSTNGVFHDGELNDHGELLTKMFLGDFEECLERNDFSTFKKTMVFVKNVKSAIAINNYLNTKYKHIPIHSRPWVLNHGRKQEVSVHNIASRSDDDTIQLYLTTNTMLMGLNIPKVRIVVMIGPLTMMGDLLQAAGRAGRREEGGRAKCVFYNCYSKVDLLHHVSPAVVEFCNLKTCLKKFCNEHFGWPSSPCGGEWCCSNCNGL